MDFLKRKYFGLPVWAYAVVAVILIGAVWYYIHKQSSSTASTTAADTSSPAPTSTPLGANNGSGSSPGFPGSFGGQDFRKAGSQTTTTTPTPTTPAPPPTINFNPTIQLPSPSPNPNPSPGTTPPPSSPATSLANALNEVVVPSGPPVQLPQVDLGNVTQTSGTEQQAIKEAAAAVAPTIVKAPSSTKTVPTAPPSTDKNGNTVTTTKTVPKTNAYNSPATSGHLT